VARENFFDTPGRNIVTVLQSARAFRVPQGLVLGLVLGCDPEDDAVLAPEAVVEAVRDAVVEPVAAAAEPAAPTGPRPIVLRRPWPPTTLPLALLATMGAPPPAPSRATIRDDDSGVIANYRPGDHVREGVEVLSIEDGLVELSNAGEVEYLSISEIPVELSADDVFYPDLVDELRLSGSMGDGTPMPPGPEYTIKAEAFAWATPRTIALLRDAIHEYARGREVPKVHIGDISRRGGGPFAPHLSHQEGRDVDIAYVLHDRGRFGVATTTNLDRRHTWALLQALLDTRAITYVFIDYEVQRLLYEHALGEGMTEAQLDPLFQYPYGRRAAQGIIRHWKGHRDHFHVRFAG
jgi:Penicillin-insensitive murein endopeptidase